MHDVNCVRLNIKAYMLIHIHKVCGLNHPFKAVYIYDYLIVNPKEGYGGYNTLEHTLFLRHNVHILRSYNHIHRLSLFKAVVNTVENMAGKADFSILQHNAVNNVTFTYEVCNKGIFRLVIYIYGSAYLLYAALGHNNHRIGHGKSFLLVVGYKYKSDSGGLLNLFKLLLHVLSEL